MVDRFGNVALDVGHEDLASSGLSLGGQVELELDGGRYLATFTQTFADVGTGELLVYEDAYRAFAVAVNRGDAAATLGLGPNTELRLRPR
jgi:S-adenosyl-L-methionine hydrolase (adenosine-forming)